MKQFVISMLFLGSFGGLCIGAAWLGSHLDDVRIWWKYGDTVQGLEYQWLGCPETGRTVVLHQGIAYEKMVSVPDGYSCRFGEADECSVSAPAKVTVEACGEDRVIIRYTTDELRKLKDCECLNGTQLVISEFEWTYNLRKSNAALLENIRSREERERIERLLDGKAQ